VTAPYFTPTEPTVDGTRQHTDRLATINLHPNLARIAVRYQRIIEQLHSRQIDTAQANIQISELVARDDNGVAWRINPVDGGWLYRTRTHHWHPGVPPASGLATASAHQLQRAAGGAGHGVDPDTVIDWTTTTDTPGSHPMTGATRPTAPPTPTRHRRHLISIICAVLAVAAVAVSLNDSEPAPTEPAREQGR
jgi:hypothetical protein